MPVTGNGPGCLARLANKDVSDFRRREAFRRRQPDIQARYQGTAADTAARP